MQPSLPNGSTWRGTCLHDFPTPRWVQKQRRVDPDQPLHESSRRIYEEPRRAVKIALNSRFSVFAIGMVGGGVALTSFPSSLFSTNTPPSTPLSIPNPYNHQPGTVCALEWSSDGYVLAVGWKHGWALFSVGGRCLASGGLGAEESARDNKKFQDAFMHGLLDLVGCFREIDLRLVDTFLVLGPWKLRAFRSCSARVRRCIRHGVLCRILTFLRN